MVYEAGSYRKPWALARGGSFNVRYGIFSDVHSNLEAFEAVLDAYSKENIDKYLCVGDIVGYAADPVACIERFKKLNCISVIGNHDAAASGLMDLEYFNPAAKSAVAWTQGIIDAEDKKFLSSLGYTYQNEELILVHGTLDSPEIFDYLVNKILAAQTFDLMTRQICFIGHSHAPGIFVQDNNRIRYTAESKIKIERDKKYIVNVGSVGQPRDNDPRSCLCIYDTGSSLIEIKRIEYNIAQAQGKIIKAGLPVFLATRLTQGI